MKFEIYIFGVTILQMEQKTNMNFDKYDWPCTLNFTYAQVYSITARGLGQDPSPGLLLCSHRGMCSNTTGAFNMLWKWDISITIIWLRSRRLQMFSKNSSLKVAQINCIRMEIVFCVPQQVLLERTNFHLGPNSFENVITPWIPLCIQFGVSAILHNVLCGFGHVKDCLKSSIGL